MKMEKNVMRSMELVGRERMEVAVSEFKGLLENKSDVLSSNNFLSGVRDVTTTSRM